MEANYELKTFDGKTLTLRGWLCERSNEGSDTVLALSTDPYRVRYEEFFARLLEHSVHRENVTVRYWVADKPMTRDQLEEAYLTTLMGGARASYWVHYSDLTGYLWTDNFVEVGGHDIVLELRQNVGKWLYMEIELHRDTTPHPRIVAPIPTRAEKKAKRKTIQGK